jgi:hypothetical protein
MSTNDTTTAIRVHGSPGYYYATLIAADETIFFGPTARTETRAVFDLEAELRIDGPRRLLSLRRQIAAATAAIATIEAELARLGVTT